ncbi:MAG: hypothetical protein CMJ49_00435 [Planctomycetaceae bacterium]|nr:hypothetical protein [Planctomycetaceae bacterium]
MAVLGLLADSEGYCPHSFDLMGDADRRGYWIDVFAGQLPSLLEHAMESEGGGPDAAARAEKVRGVFGGMLERLREEPTAFGALSVMRICELREGCLRAEGFGDVYRVVKARENDAAVGQLPKLLGELDGMADGARLAALITGVFAGNIFDLGAPDTIELFRDGGIDFDATRGRIRRPWLVDDFDALASRWSGEAYARAVLLVDNAGADVVLGMIPLARELARRGTAVVLSANTEPALNDILHAELVPLMARIGEFDPVVRGALDDGRMTCVASGNGMPLIDFTRVSEAFAEAAADADLLVIEGMGRALESNYEARFTCDTLKLAMIKERDVADLLGGEMYDVVCRFERGSGG